MKAQTPWRRQLQSLLPTLLAAYLPVFCALVILEIVHWQTNIPIWHFTWNPSAVLEAAFYVGLFSNIGILLWCSTAAICLFSFAALARDASHRKMASFFLFSGLVTSLLLMDDLFLLHDRLFPRYLSLSPKVVLGGYTILTLLYLGRFARTILATEFLLLLFAFGFLGLSTIIDSVPDGILPLHTTLEDGFKLFGIVSWFTYFTRTCLLQVQCTAL